MKNKFQSLESLKKCHPGHAPFYTQSWVYAGITSYFSQQGRFAELEFDSLESDFVIYDYKENIEFAPTAGYYGLVVEGHIDYWFKKAIPKNAVIISGHEHFSETSNFKSLGFDYWDIMLYNEFRMPALYHEINQSSVRSAEYDVVLPVGSPRSHRLEFLKILNKQKQNLTIVTDDRQSVLDTDLRFGALGIETYLNKVGLKKYESYRILPSFYDTNTGRSLDHLPHKKMHSIARVNMILETTIRDTNHAYLTEKTFKVLAHRRPFVLFGDTNSLKKLQAQGFLTFDKYCDTSYDTIADPVEKGQRIVEATKQLVESCKRYPDEIDDICRHNQELFFKDQRHADNLARFGRKILEII
jgi:hypothetical protein